MKENVLKHKLLNVMLVDDNHIDNIINKKLLERTNRINHIISFINPVSALEYLQSLSNTNETDIPDLLLIDINMPVMNGFEFLQQFDKLPDKIKNQITVYILSSSINYSDKKLAKENPYVSKYLIKPLNVEELTDQCFDK